MRPLNLNKRPASTTVARITLAHVAVLFIGASWAFGGNADWVRPYIRAWGIIGVFITLAVVLMPDRSRRDRGRWAALIPFVLFNAVTLLAIATPGLRPIQRFGESAYLPLQVSPWRPSAALPHELQALLSLFDVLYLSAFNVYLVVESRHALRSLLLVLVGNGVALAAFGTVQKFVHAGGLYFGLIPSPQTYFFSTFVYDNHWGAFIVLTGAAALGVAWHHATRHRGWEFLHTPGFASLVAFLILAVTVPLSGARVCTLLVVLLSAESLLRWSARQLSRGDWATARRALGGALLVVGLGLVAAWYVGRDVIPGRIAQTRQQLRSMVAERNIGNRSQLYADTWRMAMARPWFGWGMGSYPVVFQIYNRQEPDPHDLLPHYYHDAHSDWLQSLAEHGVVGSALLVLCALAPLAYERRKGRWPNLAHQLMVGCALVAAYAAVEFPFGNVSVVFTWWLLFFAAVRYRVVSAEAAANQ